MVNLPVNKSRVLPVIHKDFPAFIRNLASALQQPLPGAEVQYRMAHVSRIPLTPPPDHVRHAAVMLLLFPNPADWHLVLIRRKAIARDIHAGQISFPGGRAHQGETPEQAALRECEEEIGSPSHQIVTLGQLTSLHIPVSNHLVFPIVGYMPHPAQWILQRSEVEDIFEVPVEAFLDPARQVTTSIHLRDGLILPEVPAYRVAGHEVWGATAMILSEFAELMKSIQ